MKLKSLIIGVAGAALLASDGSYSLDRCALREIFRRKFATAA